MEPTFTASDLLGATEGFLPVVTLLLGIGLALKILGQMRRLFDDGDDDRTWHVTPVPPQKPILWHCEKCGNDVQGPDYYASVGMCKSCAMEYSKALYQVAMRELEEKGKTQALRTTKLPTTCPNRECGEPIQPGMTFCIYCGRELVIRSA